VALLADELLRPSRSPQSALRAIEVK